MIDFSQYTTDKQKIDALLSMYHLDNPKEVLALYALLESGKIIFTTPEGRSFDDEIFEKASAIREAQKKERIAGSQTNINKPDSDLKQKKQQNQKNKKIKKIVVMTKNEYRIRKAITIFLMFAAMCCFTYFFLYTYEAYQKDMEIKEMAKQKENDDLNAMYGDQVVEETDEFGQKKYYKILDEYKSLYNQNKNLIGWLKIDDTIIDYPIMQSENEEFYLDHNSNNEPDKNGTLFLDSLCDIRKPSTNLIIYGHNMRSGKMFGSLSDYKDESFYKEHPVITFDTIYEKASYEVMFAFHSRIYNEDEIVFKYYQFIEAGSSQEFDSNMKEMADLSLYETGISAQYGDHLLTLSTCDYEEPNGRFVVVAKKIE